MKHKLLKIMCLVLSVALLIEVFPSNAVAQVPNTPLGAASQLVNLALNLGSGQAVVIRPETEEEDWVDPPVILSTIARLTAKANSVYNNLAISNVNSYVNIRTVPDEVGDVVGKIYNNAAATILETIETASGDWYKIKSGTVEGYIKAKYFLTGADAQVRALEVGYVTATVKPASLRLRKSADLGSETITVLSGGESYIVEEEGTEFTKISVDSDIEGYVQNDYIDISVKYEEAISIEEEEAKLAEQKRLEEEAEAKAEKLRQEQEAKEKAKTSKESTTRQTTKATTAESTTQTKTTEQVTTQPSTTEQATTESSSGSESESSEDATQTLPVEESEDSSEQESSSDSYQDLESEALREAIVAEALKYVGVLDYVLGGNSLETGTDCSGFVQLIYKKFGIKLPRVSDNQGKCGEEVSAEEMRPGDLIYYGGHIGFYIGDGKVCHCSSPKSNPNTKISAWNYRAVKSIRNVIGD